MLADNMGSPRAFEFRREELAALQAEGRGADIGDDVGDDAVLASYLSSLHTPDGLMREYLLHAKLAVRLCHRLP